jgi:hypothetical protein
VAEQTVSITLKLKDSASRAAGGISKALGGIKSAAKGLTIAAGAIAGVGAAIAEMAARGERFIALRSSFESLAASIGENAGEMLEQMQTASQGLVSNAELIEKANNAILLGLPVTAKGMGELTEASIVLGRAMGLDTAKALESVVVGLGRQSKLWLDNLGIIVDVDKGNEDLAASLGKTADELTDAERKQAFYNATLEQMRAKVKEIGPIVLGLGGQIDQAKISLINWKDELFAFTSAMSDRLLPILTQVLGTTDEFGRSIEFNSKVATEFTKNVLLVMAEAFMIVTVSVHALLEVINILQIGFGALAAAWFKGWELMLKPVEIALEALAKVAAVLGDETSAKTLEILNQKVKGFADGLGDATAASLEWGKQGVEDIENNRKSLDQISESVIELKNGIKAIDAKEISEGMGGIASEIRKANKELEKTKATAEEIAKASKDASDSWIAAFEGGIPGMDRAELVETAKAFADSLGASLPDLGIISTEDLRTITKTLEDEAKKRARDQLRTASDFLSGDAVQTLGAALEGVELFGFDVGAILKAVEGISKELPSILFGSIKALLIALIADLPLLVGNIIPDLVIPLLELVPVIMQRFVENLPIMIKAIIVALPQLIVAIVSMLPNLLKVIPSLLSSILNEFFPNWWAEQKPVLEETLTLALLDAIANGKDFFSSQLPEMMKEVGESFEENITAPFVEGVNSAWEGFAEGIESVWLQTFGKLPAFAEEAGELLAAPIKKFLDSFEWPKVKLPGEGGGDGGTLGDLGISFQRGGIVPRTGPIFAHEGEMVLNRQQQQEVFAGGGAAGGAITINIDARGATEETVSKIAEAVSRAVEENVRGSADRMRRVFNRAG